MIHPGINTRDNDVLRQTQLNLEKSVECTTGVDCTDVSRLEMKHYRELIPHIKDDPV